AISRATRPAEVARAQIARPVETPSAVARPAARPPSRALRTVMAVSGPGVQITSAAMPTKAMSGPVRYSMVSSRVDQHAGIHQALGIELALGAAQRLGEQLGPLLVVERAMEAADGVMMRGRAAMLDRRRRAGRQHFHELIERHPLVQDAAEGEVEAGPVGIDVGEAAGGGGGAGGPPACPRCRRR